jgi:type I restriction enzyme S subunit
LGQNLVLLRATNGRITPEYLRWATRGREWWNEVDRYINVGAVFESLKCADIPEFQIPLPSLPKQKAIAHILGTLDDKIELNRKTNETLEAMAKALFQSWFVDFDPVRAKAEGRPTGLPDAISDLFPDSFEESELGEIPRGW